MKTLRVLVSAAVVAAASLLFVPSAALAYVPTAPEGSVTIAPGGTSVVQFTGFASGEQVTFTLSCENAAGATLAAVKTAVNSVSVTNTSTASGDASVQVTLPSNASGTCTLTATGAISGASVSVSIVVGSGVSGGGGDALPATGADNSSLIGIWIGGGVLLLGGLAVTVFSVRRQHREQRH